MVQGRYRVFLLCFWIVSATCCLSLGAAERVQPFPREPLAAKRALIWTFDSNSEGWTAQHECNFERADGVLRVRSQGNDPYLISNRLKSAVEGPLIARLRMKSSTSGSGQFFWVTRESPQWGERQSQHFQLIHDGEWHEYEVRLDVAGTLLHLRLDPGTDKGVLEIDSIELGSFRLHPLEIEQVETTSQEIRVGLRNHSDQDRRVSIASESVVLPAESARTVVVPAPGRAPFQIYKLEVRSDGVPPLQRVACVCRPDAKCQWMTQTSGDLTLLVAPDGSGAKIQRKEQLLAVIAPLVHRDGAVPVLKPRSASNGFQFHGDGTAVSLQLDGKELSVSIDAKDACEGPVVRVPGLLEQGLFAGLEYLGKGETSSSTLDIETAEHLRFAPDPLKVTMPLMAFRTEAGTVAMSWKDMKLQPIYATPNFLDGASGHRMALLGTKVVATIRVDGGNLEDAILWAAKRQGLPPLPPTRSPEGQWQLCLAALNGPLKNEAGWGHCAESKWVRQPYADIASTLFRITGQVPDLPRLVSGGAHVRNDAAWFLTGRAEEWLRVSQRRVASVIASQRPDGSFRYAGKYRRGHFEDTASGLCGRQAVTLLEHAWLTGDDDALDAGVRALEYMKRFRTPRGAQTWELSLHTPDILASAHLVRAYIRGYELTGRQEYRELARKWALTGVPFVYFWGEYPIMNYATTPVYGATNWRAPNWIGLPVQWCGGVYAYSLMLLAPHDQTLDWRLLARGILHTGEQMQYPDGDLAGCLPDVFELKSQRRAGPSINPCALVSLRYAVDGKLDSLSLAHDGSHRVVAPFPATLDGDHAQIQGRRGVNYQVLIDGKRVVTVQSQGTDRISLDGESSGAVP